MIRIEVYPVMSGMSLTMQGICTSAHGGFGRCEPVTARTILDVAVLEQHGILDASYIGLNCLVGEYGEVWRYADH